MTALQANDYNWTVSAKTASYVLVATDAGTRITMNSASATTITVNTGLFTAGDTLEIINIGAGVCTITAGTATVNTAGSLALEQYEGSTLYFTSTSASIAFEYNQSAGASGGMTLLSTTALTGASTVVSGISGSYNSLYVLVNGLYPSTNAVKLNIKPNATASTASYSSINNNFGTFASAVIYRGDITSNYDMANTSATLNTFLLQISAYANTTYAKTFTLNHNYRSYSVGAGHDNQEYQAGMLDIAAAITSLTFSFTSGNIAAGSCLVYGVK
jgi:hypothetical protein